ncbi:MAG: 30S ribosomal protein S9 [Candidatus Sungiibacteriota bacterium]
MPPKVKPKATKEKRQEKKTKPIKKKLPQKEEKAAVVKKEAPSPAMRPATEEIKVPAETLPEENGGRYWEAVGRRKTAIARVRLFTRGEKGIWVNDKEYRAYFQYPGLFLIPEDPLKKMKSFERFRVTAHIYGGGKHAQAEALRHGISRALVKFNQDFRKRLKRAGFLTRDSRMKERKKFGLKGARRAPQWQKR